VRPLWRQRPPPGSGPPRVSPELFRAVVEELDQPVVTIGGDGLVRSNRRARGLHGLPQEPLRPEHWAARLRVFEPGSDRALAAEELPLLRAFGGEDVTDLDLEIRGADDAAAVFAVSAHPIRRGRRVVGAFSVLLERAGEAGFPHHEVLRHAAEGIAVICAATGAFVYTNDAWTNALGYGPGELIGEHVSSVNAPTDRVPQEIAVEMLDILDRGAVWRDEVALRRRDGTSVWWEQTVSRYEDGRGRPAWIIVGRDATARHAATADLRDAERRFRTAFEALPVAAALTDEDGRVLAVNDALVALIGAPGEEVLGRALESVLPPVDLDAARALATAARRGELSGYRFEARCRGAEPPVGVSTTIVRDVDGRVLEAVVVVEPARPPS
jgi:PAS domain S-box-containing protein